MRQTHAQRLAPISRPLIVAGTIAIACAGATVWLWVHYGEAVFFETIRAGFVACFG